MAIMSAIGAVAGIGAALIGSSATKKAANTAADTSLQVAESNNALARDIYGQNRTMLNSYNNRGNVAGDAINALLGLPVANDTAAPGGQFGGATVNGYNPAFNGAGLGVYGGGGVNGIGGGLVQYGLGQTGQGEYFAPVNYNALMTAAGGTPAAPAMTPATANNAFQNYLNSTGYQFRLGEGNKALNASFAARGLANSGAAARAAMNYGQNIASDEFGRYLGYLSNQQGVGLSGASAVAGVGQNYVNNVTANNNSAGTAAANAALVRGNATANMWAGIGNSLGQFLGSSFKG